MSALLRGRAPSTRHAVVGTRFTARQRMGKLHLKEMRDGTVGPVRVLAPWLASPPAWQAIADDSNQHALRTPAASMPHACPIAPHPTRRTPRALRLVSDRMCRAPQRAQDWRERAPPHRPRDYDQTLAVHGAKRGQDTPTHSSCTRARPHPDPVPWAFATLVGGPRSAHE